jgi:MFS family permease
VLLPTPPRESQKASAASHPTRGTFVALLAAPGFLLLLVMNSLNGAAYWPLRNWLPTFFQEELKVNQTNAGLYGASVFNGAAFLGMLLGSTISDRWAAWSPRVRMLVPAAGFLMAAPCLFTIGATNFVAVILFCILVAGMSQGFLDANLMPAACTLTEPRHRATAYGLLNFAGITAGGIMTYAGGVLKEGNVPFAVLFQAASGLILLAGLLLLLVRPRTHLD